MPSNGLPDDLNHDKLAEAALAILSLTLHDGRVWKGLDWSLMDLLEEKGWIVSAQSKAKSVVLTEEGGRAADRIRATAYPEREDFAARYVLHPPSEDEMLELFGRADRPAADEDA